MQAQPMALPVCQTMAYCRASTGPPARNGAPAVSAFMQFSQYMPHGMCLLWQPWLVLLWAGSDGLIFLSYMAIPIALLIVLRRRQDVPNAGLVVLFASFILLCGLTHLLGIVTLWIPIYPIVGVVKLATGIVSAITAVSLFRLVPQLIALPSPAAYSATNELLREEIAAHEATLADLRRRVRPLVRAAEDIPDLLGYQLVSGVTAGEDEP